MRLSFSRCAASSVPVRFAALMAPLLAVVFLQLSVLAQTVKYHPPEGQFEIIVPAAGEWPPQDDGCCTLGLPDIHVRMEAAENGRLTSLKLGHMHLGNDEKAFGRLNAEILRIIGRSGNPLTRDIRVVIDADDALHHEYLIRCISACTGRLNPGTGQVDRYVRNIVLAPSSRAEQARL
ncbi:MAG: biopolymer transporter ExbD [Planctomycetaceae bacterium]|nr:biopolymer transporter ExbD [Planctomycetaceae bacterium]